MIKQWLLKPPKGNCFQCCVSAVTKIPIKHVPNFCIYSDWWKRLNKFCYFYGLVPFNFVYDKRNEEFANLVNIPVIISGKSPRGRFWHAVVKYKGIIYDPHPRNNGLSSLEEQMIIVPRNRFYINNEKKVVCRYII